MPRLFLIGARACGKTTVGRLLARQLNFPFYDLDEELTKAAGQSIASIVASQGWEEFRRLETQTLQKVGDSSQNMVIATGGGIVLAAVNRLYMAASGMIVWLNAPAALMAARLAANPVPGQRPSLTGKGLLQEVDEILRERRPLYAACAHFEIDGSLPAEDACKAIFTAAGSSLHDYS